VLTALERCAEWAQSMTPASVEDAAEMTSESVEDAAEWVVARECERRPVHWAPTGAAQGAEWVPMAAEPVSESVASPHASRLTAYCGQMAQHPVWVPSGWVRAVAAAEDAASDASPELRLRDRH
jgi:hypothetical protein